MPWIRTRPAAIGAVWTMAEERRHPPVTPSELLEALGTRLHTFVSEAWPGASTTTVFPETATD